MMMYNVAMTTIIANHKYYVVCRELGDQVINYYIMIITLLPNP